MVENMPRQYVNSSRLIVHQVIFLDHFLAVPIYWPFGISELKFQGLGVIELVVIGL